MRKLLIHFTPFKWCFVLNQLTVAFFFFFITVDNSKDFEEFLECIGKKVSMSGWQNFAGGLDTKASNLTGM